MFTRPKKLGILTDNVTLELYIQSCLSQKYECRIYSSLAPDLSSLVTGDDLDILIIKAHLAKQGGLEVLTKLEPDLGEVKTIVISSTPAAEEHAIASGANAFLTIPFAEETLLAQLNRVMTQV